jgi:hypothetical protein
VRVDNVRSDNEIDIQVVTTAEQFMHAIAVRAICFMEETGLSVSQTIDGNDYQATHFVSRAARACAPRLRLAGSAYFLLASDAPICVTNLTMCRRTTRSSICINPLASAIPSGEERRSEISA